jgi:hypothetical protein
LYAFGEWSVGAYGNCRKGATWEDEINGIRSLLLERIPNVVDDQWYAHVGGDTFRMGSKE